MLLNPISSAEVLGEDATYYKAQKKLIQVV